MSKRSRAYPALTLREAVEVLGRVVRALGWTASSRDTIAQTLGYANGSTGLAGRTVAALAHYGLLDRNGGSYRPSLLAERVLHVSELAVRRQALRESFMKPALFRKIVDRYESNQRIPMDLARILLELGITDGAKEDAAAIFMESAQFAGILDSAGRFLPRPSLQGPQGVVGEGLGDMFPEKQEATDHDVEASQSPSIQKLEFSLTEGKQVKIEIPQNLNERDLDVLRSMIGFLEVQLKANRPAAVSWPSKSEVRGSN